MDRSRTCSQVAEISDSGAWLFSEPIRLTVGHVYITLHEMAQFNMQVDRELQAKLRLLQRRLGVASKAQAVRLAIERACEQTSPQKRGDAWWRTYLTSCREVPRLRTGKVMTEQALYRDLF